MSREGRRRLDLTARLVVVLWAITFAHHVYGGIRFDSPGRTVAGVVFTGVLAVTLWLGRLGESRRWARFLWLATVVLFWVIALGLYEGGYNHTLYVTLRLLAPDTAAQLYAADSDALLSNDILFQGTGVLTLVAGLAVTASLPRAFRPAPAHERERISA